jgi:hypothetical protein
MKFVNPEVDRRFTTRPQQGDCDIRIPKLNWRSKLSRITPRIAEAMIANGSNLIVAKPVAVLQQVISANQSVDIAVVPPLLEDIPEVVVVLPSHEDTTEQNNNDRYAELLEAEKKLDTIMEALQQERRNELIADWVTKEETKLMEEMKNQVAEHSPDIAPLPQTTTETETTPVLPKKLAKPRKPRK